MFSICVDRYFVVPAAFQLLVSATAVGSLLPAANGPESPPLGRSAPGPTVSRMLRLYGAFSRCMTGNDLSQSCPWVGLTHGLGWVGLDRVTQNGPMDNSGLSVAIPSASVAGGHLLAWRSCRLIVVLSDPQLSGTTYTRRRADG